MDPSFIEFEFINKISPELKAKFISQATKNNLNDLLKKYKDQIHVLFHKSSLDNVYLVMITCHSDYILINLANECNFPRGFPILWIPDQSMQYFGFYPKFGNDERQIVDNETEFDNVISVRFFKKFSGFLGQIMAFKIDTKYYWTVTSKNSAHFDTKFVQDAKRIVEPYVTTQLVQRMVNDNIHICAEIMSKIDQTHGTRVFTEAPVITCVGQSANDKFINYFNHKDLVNFCTEFNLPCDSAIIIDNKLYAQKFMKSVSAQRDFMDDDKLEQLIQETKNITTHKGTINHENILGKCLEGLVIHLVHDDGSKTIKKYKFPNYTIRTMLIREQLENFKMRNYLKQMTQQFVDRWCVSEKGKAYWYDFGLQAFYTYVTDTSIKYDPDIGTHIQLAEIIKPDKHIEELFNNYINEHVSEGTVIIIGGPIGSGKTTIMEKICKHDLNKFVKIDGDLLDMLDMGTVLMMGKERADYSRWLVIKSLMNGKIPVISTGCGIFFGQNKNAKFELTNQIYKTLNIDVKIVFLVPSPEPNIIHLDKKYNPESIYHNKNIVIDAVNRRVKSGEWKINPKQHKNIKEFTNFIYTKSIANCKFALKLMQETEHIYGFPLITSGNYGIQHKLDFSEILSSVNNNKSNLTGTFRQIRILTQIDADFIGHITWLFGEDIKYTLKDFETLQKLYTEQIMGTIIILKNNVNEMCFALPNKPIHYDESTHITINSGNHEPKETKQVVLAIKQNNKEITLPVKNSKQNVKYDLTNINKTKCSIKILGAFGI